MGYVAPIKQKATPECDLLRAVASTWCSEVMLRRCDYYCYS